MDGRAHRLRCGQAGGGRDRRAGRAEIGILRPHALSADRHRRGAHRAGGRADPWRHRRRHPGCAAGGRRAAGRTADRAPAIGHARARLARHGLAPHRDACRAGRQAARAAGRRCARRRHRAGRRPRPALCRAQRGDRRAHQHGGGLERRDRRQASYLPRHRRHRGRRRLLAPHGGGVPHAARAGHPLPRPSGSGDRRSAARFRPPASPISTMSTATRRASSRAWCRWCACTPSRRA